MRYSIASVFLALVLGACGSTSPKQPHQGKQQPPPNLPVSMETARQTALAQVQGQVEEEELDEKDGRWIYEFDIRPAVAGAPKKEVEVDATTGAVLKIEDDD